MTGAGLESRERDQKAQKWNLWLMRARELVRADGRSILLK